MWVMVAGPYGRDPAKLRALNVAALALWRAGHVPIIGVNMALPMVEAAGEEAYEALMMPMSLALVERCDGCLRIGGESKGADAEVARFRAAGKPVWRSVEEVK